MTPMFIPTSIPSLVSNVGMSDTDFLEALDIEPTDPPEPVFTVAPSDDVTGTRGSAEATDNELGAALAICVPP